jgi:tRNA(Ile)-lysidine synthase
LVEFAALIRGFPPAATLLVHPENPSKAALVSTKFVVVNVLSDLVRRTISERQLFETSQKILVAVSGGLDSMVLLHLMNELARREGWRLTIVHLNHRLRGKSSEADARLVERAAKKLGWPAVIGSAKVRDLARREKLSLEMAARKARHEFFVRTAVRLRIRTVALGHHADDQVELFFLRLFRGSGPHGLVGMQWRNPSPADKRIELVRPLLGQGRAALAKYARENKVIYREDASNAALDIQRNRIRHELLPLIRRRYQPALAVIIGRVLEITQAEAEVVTEAAQRQLALVPGVYKPARGGSSSFSSDPSPAPSPHGKGSGIGSLVAKLSGTTDLNSKAPLGGTEFGKLPVAVQRRSLQLQLFGLGIAPDYDLIEQLRVKEERAISVSWDKFGSSRRSRKSLMLIRDSNGLVRIKKGLARSFPDKSAVLYLDRDTGKTHFDGIWVCWDCRVSEGPQRPKRVSNCEWFDADRVGNEILLRHWRPGDRFQPIGMPSAVKLQDFFTSQKVPRERRHQVVLAVSADNQVFWVEGMRISERFKLTTATNRRLQWRWQRL